MSRPSISPNHFNDQSGPQDMKLPAYSSGAVARTSRQFFADMLWRAFPSPSERDLSIKAARVLDVSPRQVINWLRLEHDAKITEVLAVLAICGAEIVFAQIERRL